MYCNTNTHIKIVFVFEKVNLKLKAVYGCFLSIKWRNFKKPQLGLLVPIQKARD